MSYDTSAFALRIRSLADWLATVLTEKRAAYGDNLKNCGPIMALLYPNGLKPEQYDDALLVVRIMDKLTRISNGAGGAGGEDAWFDIAGYALCKIERDGPARLREDRHATGCDDPHLSALT